MRRVGWLLVILAAMINCGQPPKSATVIDIEGMRRMLTMPDFTAAQWQEFCDPSQKGDYHCSIQVVVDCPPDCGVYRILRNDTLLRRIW